MRWVIGNGDDIVANKGCIVEEKVDFSVNQNPFYEGRKEVISSLFLHNEKWNTILVKECFLKNDVYAILAPQRETVDKVTWTGSNNEV